MGAPETFEKMALNLARRSPAFRRTQHNHRPARTAGAAAFASRDAMFTNLIPALFYRGRRGLMHAVDVRSFDEVWGPTVSAEKTLKFLVRNSREQSWIV